MTRAERPTGSPRAALDRRRFIAIGFVLLTSFVAPTMAWADILFDNDNRDGVARGPRRATVIDLKTPALISRIRTCHWNDGRGTVAAGTIAMRGADGRTFGPWEATGLPRQGEVPMAIGKASPMSASPPGVTP
jgi:hypothetical protein